MNAPINILRRGLMVGSAISLLFAIAGCIGLAASFIKPALGIIELYRIANLTRTAGFCVLGS
jgi:hypothetical protein